MAENQSGKPAEDMRLSQPSAARAPTSMEEATKWLAQAITAGEPTGEAVRLQLEVFTAGLEQMIEDRVRAELALRQAPFRVVQELMDFEVAGSDSDLVVLCSDGSVWGFTPMYERWQQVVPPIPAEAGSV